jgi:phosphoenolpyruvate carboxylase
MTLRETAEFQTKDLGGALSVDIKLLGNLLGKIILEQHEEESLKLVEYVRHTAKARRNGDADAALTLNHIIENLDLDAKRVLIKAFGSYFQLINIAEDQQRIRVLRSREAEGNLDETIPDAIQTLKSAGLSADEVRELLTRINIRLVLTAHPSESKRKAVLMKLQQIADMMTTADRQVLLPREQKALEEALSEEIEELWQTRPTRAIRATVADEVDFGVYFIVSVIMDVVVDAYIDLQAALENHYPGEDWSALPALLNFASWIGGDRDGNPNVTADVTLETLKTHRETARKVYLDELEFLREDMTQSIDEITVSQALLDSLEDRYGVTTEHPGDLYRLKMKIIRAKLADDQYASSRTV